MDAAFSLAKFKSESNNNDNHKYNAKNQKIDVKIGEITPTPRKKVSEKTEHKYYEVSLTKKPVQSSSHKKSSSQSTSRENAKRSFSISPRKKLSETLESPRNLISESPRQFTIDSARKIERTSASNQVPRRALTNTKRASMDITLISSKPKKESEKTKISKDGPRYSSNLGTEVQTKKKVERLFTEHERKQKLKKKSHHNSRSSDDSS